MTKDLIRVFLYDSLKIINSREVEIPFYSGDFSLFPQVAVEGAKFPKKCSNSRIN